MRERFVVAVLTALWTVQTGAVSAQQQQVQDAPQQASVPATEDQTATEQQPAEDLFAQDQINQLVAPIALYPDALLAQVLMASTYPLDVVQAARWRKDNADLEAESLEKAAADQPWDQSVKALVFFPDVLTYMNENLDWTQDLGDAVLAQQDDVTDAVQALRREAKKAGNLQTTEQQRVEVEPQGEGEAQAGTETIIIQPADPEVVYVPSYDPSSVYGRTDPPATAYYPQAYSTPTASYAADTGSDSSDSLVSFGVGALAGGLLTAAIMWNNNDRYDRIYYGGGGYYGRPGYWGNSKYWNGGYRQPANINIDRSINKTRGDINISRDRGDVNINKGIQKWTHNPERRGGVRYRDERSKQKFAKARTGGIERDRARGRDPNRKRPASGGGDRPKIGGADGPRKGERKRPATREAKRPATREAKRPATRAAKSSAKKQAKRPQTRHAKAPHKRDVKLSQPSRKTKKPSSRPANKAKRPARHEGGRGSAFKAQRGGHARAASARGSKSRSGGGGHRGGGHRGGGHAGRGGGRRR